MSRKWEGYALEEGMKPLIGTITLMEKRVKESLKIKYEIFNVNKKPVYVFHSFFTDHLDQWQITLTKTGKKIKYKLYACVLARPNDLDSWHKIEHGKAYSEVISLGKSYPGVLRFGYKEEFRIKFVPKFVLYLNKLENGEILYENMKRIKLKSTILKASF